MRRSSFSNEKSGPSIVGIESIDEEFFVNGAWVPRRRINGDENSQGQALRLHATDLAQGRIYKVQLYRYRNYHSPRLGKTEQFTQEHRVRFYIDCMRQIVANTFLHSRHMSSI
jgi:hypothetical protein